MLIKMKCELNETFADAIVNKCLNQFNKLAKTGKPKDNEWTVLSGVVKSEPNVKLDSLDLEVVALGSGSKCIGSSKIPLRGNLLHDSHAEVIARRSFMVYLLNQIELTLDDHPQSIFKMDGKGFFLKSGIRFHFYCSGTPCGDSTIFEKVISENELLPPLKKRKADHENGDVANCNSIAEQEYGCLVQDIYRTGAKSVPGERQDSKATGKDYHTVGVLRTKPGRGDPTLSHSCSDKIFKWTVLGVQGALLMLFLNHPIYFETITIGDGPFNKDSLHRAILGRFATKLKDLREISPFAIHSPTILKSSIPFLFSKNANRSLASSTSLIWSLSVTHEMKHELSIEGRRQGCTKKTPIEATQVSICKFRLLQFVQRLILKIRSRMLDLHPSSSLVQYQNIMSSVCNLLECNIEAENFEKLMQSINYKSFKSLSIEYQEMWSLLKTKVVYNWTRKSGDAQKFAVSQ